MDEWMSGWWNLWKTFASTTREIPSIWQSLRWHRVDRVRLQIRADNWHKNEKFAFIFYVFVAYTAHMGVHRWILRQCTDRCRESWESQSGESCEQCAGINILSCAGINACCSNHLGFCQKTISAVGGGNCLDLSWEALQHLNKPD